jgi:hypothetical protein
VWGYGRVRVRDRAKVYRLQGNTRERERDKLPSKVEIESISQ